ncbi:hypothetical protein Taro_037423 [Colocasia esculenta]|uniref:RAWUL domain-containing protein n=1 Tax=Colocasia esculenta TaxID=4460 RepID=A0A843WPN3_COLES|nr:hypothetical protein [Colocasia esculenta]
MVPARKLLRGRCDGYGGHCYDVDIRHKGFCQGGFPVSSGPALMAEDDSRSGGGGGCSEDEEAGGGGEGRGDERGEVGTSSKGEERDEGWLRLSIGEGGGGAVDGYSLPCGTKLEAVPVDPGKPRRVGELLELDLFRERPPDSRPVPRPPLPVAPPAAGLPTMAPAMVPLFPQHPGSSLLSYRAYAPDVTWGFWSPQASTSSALPGPYNSRLFVYPMPGSSASPAEAESSAAAGDVRVVSPPSRPHAGVWFVLQASQNQDGRMTVRLLMKYLVNKLGLDNESEVEITCRGQQLHPFLTLQHVRDSIWCSRDVVPLLPDTPSNHVMTLHYATFC